MFQGLTDGTIQSFDNWKRKNYQRRMRKRSDKERETGEGFDAESK